MPQEHAQEHRHVPKRVQRGQHSSDPIGQTSCSKQRSSARSRNRRLTSHPVPQHPQSRSRGPHRRHRRVKRPTRQEARPANHPGARLCRGKGGLLQGKAPLLLVLDVMMLNVYWITPTDAPWQSILDCSEANEGFYVKCGFRRAGLEMAHYYEAPTTKYEAS